HQPWLSVGDSWPTFWGQNYPSCLPGYPHKTRPHLQERVRCIRNPSGREGREGGGRNRDPPQDLERGQCVLQRPSLQVPGCHSSAETSSEEPAHLDRIKPEVNRGT